MRVIVATAGWLVVGVGAVFAQDATPSTNWQGLYLGVTGGETFGKGRLVDLNSSQTKSGSGNSEAAGVYGGYNWQHGAFVLGAEVDWMRDFSSASIDLFTLRARAGWAFGSSMIYATAGIGTEDGYLEHRGTGQRIDKSFTGIVAGGGIETMLSHNLSLRAEGLYFDPGKEEFDFAASGQFPAASVGLDVSHMIWRAGLTYHID